MRRYSSYTDIAGCKLWVDSLAGISMSGPNAIALADQSGAGLFSGVSVAGAVVNGLAAAVGPIFNATDSNFGGKPSLTYVNGATHTCLDTPTVAAQGGTWTFLVCLRATGAQDAALSKSVIDGPGGVGTANRFVLSAPGRSSDTNGTTDALVNMGPFLSKTTTIPALGTAPHVLGVAVVQAATASLMALYGDGALVRRGQWANATQRTLIGLRIGHGVLNAQVVNFDGEINALVAWNAFLSDGQIKQMSELMARRQGVTLPARTAKTRTALPAPGAVGGRTRIL